VKNGQDFLHSKGRVADTKWRLIYISSRTKKQILNSLFVHIKIYVQALKITGCILSSAFEVIFQILIIVKSWNIKKNCWSCFKTLKFIIVWGSCIENKEKPQKRDRLLSTHDVMKSTTLLQTQFWELILYQP